MNDQLDMYEIDINVSIVHRNKSDGKFSQGFNDKDITYNFSDLSFKVINS